MELGPASDVRALRCLSEKGALFFWAFCGVGLVALASVQSPQATSWFSFRLLRGLVSRIDYSMAQPQGVRVRGRLTTEQRETRSCMNSP